MQEKEFKGGFGEGNDAWAETTHQGTSPQTSSSSDTRVILDIATQANHLFDYLDKLNTIADRSSRNAITPKQGQHCIEGSDFSNQLERSRAELERKSIAYADLEKTTMEQFNKMEGRFTELQAQLGQREQELKSLTAEISSFLKRQQELSRGNPSDQDPSDVEPLMQEIAALKAELTKRDDTIQAKSNTFRKMETEYRSKIQDLENTTRENAARLEHQEAVIKQKEALIQSTAMKEVEIGKLIKRLSAECDKLNGELQEKNRRLSQLENEKIQPTNEAKVWRPVVGRMQQEPT